MARVLLVDDDPGAHETIGPILRLARHEFGGALTGRDAICLAREFGPDVALVDIRLPDISGVEVIATLRKEMPLVACIVMTSYFLYEHATEALRAGACEWLEKPAWEEDILKAVRSAVSRRRQREARELHLAPSEPHDVMRLAELSVKYISSRRDHRQLRRVGLHVGEAAGTIKTWSETAHFEANEFRDFTRALRAVYRLQHEPGATEEGLLDIVDPRSLKKFRVRSGGTVERLPQSVSEFFDQQQFVAESKFVTAVRQVLESADVRRECERPAEPRATAADHLSTARPRPPGRVR